MEEIIGLITSCGGGGLGALLIGVVILLVGFLPLILCPMMASKRGRSGCAWFIVGLLLGWIGVLIIACMRKEE